MRIVRQSIKLLRCYQLSSVRCHHLDQMPMICSTRGIPTSIIPIKSSYSSRTYNQRSSSELERMYPEGRGVVNHFKRLAKKIKEGKLTSSQVLQDTTFKEIVKELSLNIESPNPSHQYEFSELCSIYCSLLEIGLNVDQEVMETLVKSVAAQMDQASTWDLRCLLAVCSPLSRTELGKELINDVASQLEHHISQMPLEDLVKFLNPSASILPASLIEKILQTMTQVITAKPDHSPFIGLYLKLIVRLGNLRMRPIPLLHALSDALNKCDLNDYPEPLHLINTVYALNTLNYADIRLLSKIETVLTTNDNLKVVKMSALSALLVSAGKMNWKCESILHSIAASIRDRSSPLRHQEFIAFILVAARLNFKHDYLAEIINERILPEISQTTVPDIFIWFDLVWSLVILDQAPARQVESVFNQEFIQKLRENKSPEAAFSKWKLMNVRHYAHTKNFHVDQAIDLSSFKHPLRSVDSQNLGDFATGILTSFIVRQKDLVTNFESPVGCIVDAEFIVNKEFKILPIKEYGSHVEPLKDLPSDYKRISLIAHGFKDFILNDSNLIGPRQFVINSLNELGTNVLVIKSSDINKEMKPVERVKALRNKISELFS